MFVSAYSPRPLILSIHRSDRTSPGGRSRSHTSPTTKTLCVQFDKTQERLRRWFLSRAISIILQNFACTSCWKFSMELKETWSLFKQHTISLGSRRSKIWNIRQHFYLVHQFILNVVLFEYVHVFQFNLPQYGSPVDISAFDQSGSRNIYSLCPLLLWSNRIYWNTKQTKKVKTASNLHLRR